MIASSANRVTRLYEKFKQFYLEYTHSPLVRIVYTFQELRGHLYSNIEDFRQCCRLSAFHAIGLYANEVFSNN